MFGIAWGVGSLLLLVGVGEGFRSGNKRAFGRVRQEHHVSLSRARTSITGSMTPPVPILLTYQDYVDIRAQAHTSALPALYFPTDLHQSAESPLQASKSWAWSPN